MLSELSSIFIDYADIEECNNVVEKFNILAKHLTNDNFNPFGPATLQAIAQITIKLLHHLKNDDVERVLHVLLRNGLLSREILIYLLSNFNSSISSLLCNHLSDVQKLTPNQQALLLKYAVLSHKCDQHQLDGDLFRSITLLFIGGCTVGPYVTLRSLFLSGMCNHKTRYGDCLGARLIDECVTSETSRGVHSRNVISKLTEKYFINARDKQQDQSMLDSTYKLLKDIGLESMWKEITMLPPVTIYMDMRSQDNFHRNLHLRFMQNEISIYILACSISHCEDVPDIVSQVFSNTFTMFSSDLIKSTVMLFINTSTESLLTTDLNMVQSIEELLPSSPDTLSGEPEIKKTTNVELATKLDVYSEEIPLENKEFLAVASAGTGADSHFPNLQLEEDYNSLIVTIANDSFKQFASSFYYNYFFMAGSLRGLDAGFLDEATAFIYNL